VLGSIGPQEVLILLINVAFIAAIVFAVVWLVGRLRRRSG